MRLLSYRKKREPEALQEETQTVNTHKNRLPEIIAYGFETYGFEIPENRMIETERFRIVFISLSDRVNLDSVAGVIIPSGIFEKFQDNSTYIARYIDVYCKRDLLLQREKEVFNLINKGGWVCCLVDKIIDRVQYGTYETKDCSDTDLVKYLLNAFSINRKIFKGSAIVNSTNDEFNGYIERYGIAKTILQLSYMDQDRKILAKMGDTVVGVEFYGSVFFLPFHTTDFSKDSLIAILAELSRALFDYLQKRRADVPDWVNEFSFEAERTINVEIENLLASVNQLQQKLLTFHAYKGVLTQSGDSLKDNVVSILRNFFLLNVTDVEDFKEDALIRDEQGNPSMVIEIKGTKSGIKRKYINQLDSNRKRISLSSTTPGLLIVNDQIGIENIKERYETSVADEQIKHAKKMNILILRTVDLLFLMKSLEEKENRGPYLMKYCQQGGGRLYVTDATIEVIT